MKEFIFILFSVTGEDGYQMAGKIQLGPVLEQCEQAAFLAAVKLDSESDVTVWSYGCEAVVEAGNEKTLL